MINEKKTHTFIYFRETHLRRENFGEIVYFMYIIGTRY